MSRSRLRSHQLTQVHALGFRRLWPIRIGPLIHVHALGLARELARLGNFSSLRNWLGSPAACELAQAYPSHNELEPARRARGFSQP